MQCKLWLPTVAVLCLSIFAAPPTVFGEGLEAFTEPYKRVAIPASEVGVISKILVSEGDAVSQKQLLAQLDDTVLQATLEVARAAKEALGNRRGAEADLEMRAAQLESYRELRSRGNATQRELDRAETEHLQSQARLQAVREELEVRRLEYERVKAQIKRRQVESPIDGFVVQIAKEEGEFVSPTDPVVMHVVQLNTLKVVFSVPMRMAADLQSGQPVSLSVGYDQIQCEGIIEFVSPVADAQSATVRVKVRIPNRKGLIPSGAVCYWTVESLAPIERVGQTTPSRHTHLK